MRRTGNFARALQTGRFERTFQSGHPGVTTMWLGLLALWPDAATMSGITGPDPMVTLMPRFMEFLVRARVMFAAFNASLVVLILYLTWRLIGPGPALLAAPLLVLDPFMIAHSQVVHVDAVSAGLITVAAMSAIVYWWRDGGLAYLLLCGVFTGLAVLTKAPSLFLGIFVPAIALWSGLSSRSSRSLRASLASLVVCGAISLGVAFILWPSLWVAPVDTIRTTVEYQVEQAESPHLPGNFFRGQPTTDPGPLFYPVALAFRLTPLAVLGLATLVVVLPPVSLRGSCMPLVYFVLGFLIFLTLASKKLDRYALPLFPALGVLAGLGLWVLWRKVAPAKALAAFGVFVVFLTVAQVLPLATVSPYPLAYYNPLVGGGPAARRSLLVGWGEGLDQVAAYLNAQPDASTARIAVYFPLVRNFQGLVSGTVQRFGSNEPADYVVDYVNGTQRRQTPIEVAGMTPEMTVDINGIPYARVYRLAPPRRIRNP